ncbi:MULTISPECIES: hypothetical protein [Acidobacteriaceae]|uniref:hypothetical protein n=1 Tax=Acidobacteriaceae TaxID=204434 RepID=UPI00131D122E|nr:MULTISPECIES: hypothetical protein [Acidobacteriaceae]MDW5266982.1 hypothetical protein [Edaphobacter sp.]
MSLGYDPVPVLESVGYTEREAAFLYLVVLHSGYFLRRQYDRFIRRERGAIAAQLLRKATALGHLQSVACGQARYVYHLTSREMYAAVGLAASQHRRLKGDSHIKSRLMVLDFVLDHLGDRLLDSSESRHDFFTQTLGLSENLLPVGTGSVHLFPEEFPILIYGERSVRFSFIDEGTLSTSGFENFLRRYRAVFAALPGFELLYLADSDRNFERVGKVFAVLYPMTRALGVTAMTPRGVDHFLEYLGARESHDTQRRPVTLRDLAVLREGEHIYTTLEHQALCAAWQIGSTNAERIRQRFQQQGPQAKFTTALLPYTYPLYQFRRERKPQPQLGSSGRSSESLLLGKQLVAQQALNDGGE